MSNPIGDRNLLFGILAFDRKFIDANMLIAAMKAWLLDKRKGLAQILREQKALTENQHALLEEFVDEHLTKYDHDAQKSLAAVTLMGPARDELEKIDDADLQASLMPVSKAPIEEAELTPEPVVATVVKPAAPVKAAVKATPKPKGVPSARRRGVPVWILLLGVVAMAFLGAIAGTIAVVVAFLFMAPDGQNNNIGPIVQEHRDAGPIVKDAEKDGPPPNDGNIRPPQDGGIVPPKDGIEPPKDGIVIPPKDGVVPPKDGGVIPPKDGVVPPKDGGVPPKDGAVIPPKDGVVPPKDGGAVVNPPVEPVKPGEFVLELPNPASRAVLSADGRYVAFLQAAVGTFGFREGPAFNVEKTVKIDNTRTSIQPLTSSADGKRLALTAGSVDGPQVFIWNWSTMSIERAIPFSNLAVECAFSPDGKHLATYLIQTDKGRVEFWLHLHEIATGNSRKQWRLDAEPSLFGFTPDGSKFFHASRKDAFALAWNIDTGATNIMAFPHLGKKYTFARDFSKFAFVELPGQLQLGFVDGPRPIGRLNPGNQNNLEMKTAAFSPDNRMVLIGCEDIRQRPKVVGVGMLVDLVNGKTVSVTGALSGIPERVELASNGLGLVQGPTLPARLYRFPTPPPGAFVMAPLPPTPGFVPLFNGRDLTGWKPHNLMPGNWRVENGVLIGSPQGKGGGRLYTDRPQPKDFHLRVEARLNEPGAGAVNFRCPDGSILGYESIFNSVVGGMRAGGLNVMVPGRTMALPRGPEPMIPLGQWFMLDIIAEGPKLVVKVDGKIVTDVVDNNNLAAGHIALSLYAKSTIEIRRVEIKELNFVAAPVPMPAPPGQFVSLFNGKDLDGWKVNNAVPGNWRVENGILTANTTPATQAYLFTTRADYKDFHLRAEARFTPSENVGSGAGVLARATFDFFGYDSMIHYFQKTGLMYVRSNKRVRMDGKPVQLPAGEWFTLEVIAEGNQLKVKVNGNETTNFTDVEREFLQGHIALRLGRESKIEVKKIEVREGNFVAAPNPAPVVPAAGFVPLFNGKDLTGWKSNRVPPTDWRVVNGVLTGSSPGVRELFTIRDDYGDFHLRLEGRINDDGNNFVVVRYPFDEPKLPHLQLGGYAARISSSPKDLSKTGSLFIYDLIGMRNLAVQQPLVPAGQWFTLDIIAVGNQIEVKVNDKLTKSFVDTNLRMMGGRIVMGFGDSSRNTLVEYKRIDIKEFKAVGPPPMPAPPRPLEAFVSLVNGKDLTGWRVEGNPGWKVMPNGDLVGEGPATALISNRTDFRNFIAKIEMSASGDAEAFLAFRAKPAPAGKVLGMTSRLIGEGGSVRAGYTGSDGNDNESGNQPIRVKPGEVFEIEFDVKPNGIWASTNGRQTSGVIYPPDRYPPGAIGIYIAKGTVTIRKFEVSAEAPAAPVVPMPPPVGVAGEWTPLFNGKDLVGWQPHLRGAANWRVENGVLTGAGDEPGILHTARADYKDFHLRAEARFTAPKDGETSGMAFRSAFGRTGYETLFTDGKFTGGLYLSGKDFGKAVEATMPANVVSGEWCTLEFIAQGNRVKVKVNGKETTDFDDVQNLFTAGHIALRQGADCKVEFRKIEIAEIRLVAAPPIKVEPPIVKGGGEFVPLFNLKDLAGWQPHAKRPGNWRVENGVLIGSAPIGGSLYSTRNDYQDFHLRAEVRINDKGFGRVFFRAAYDPTKIPFKVFGYEALINQRPVGDKTGTLTAIGPLGSAGQQAKESATKAGEWYTMEVIAKGDRVTVLVAGDVVAEYEDAARQFARNGHIALHQDANAVVEFRKVEIKDLSAVPKVGEAPPPLPPGGAPRGGEFVSLFGKNDLTGWNTAGKQKNNWTFENGILVGSGNISSRIHSPRDDYKNFHLRFEARIADQSAGGVYVRAPLDLTKGYEAKINSTHPSPSKTGSLLAHFPGQQLGLARVTDPPTPFGAWFTMEIIAVDNRITILVNGKVTAESTKIDPQHKSGHIAFRQETKSTIELRKIEIKELP